ncbi:MAG TPA: hypothetical protein VFC46_07685 [Humisphaera sp.]|nr:hypothetical protein [Humisphaera sp.]
MNGVLIFAFLASADYFMRGAKIWQRILVGIFILTLPLSGKMIIEFRPDVAWGLTAAMAVILPLRTSFLNSSWKYRLAAGGWFAAALLVKPSIFPLTLATVGLAWLLAAACDRAAYGREVTVRRILRSWLVAAAPVFVFAGTHYILNFRVIAGYIAEILHGQNSALWYVAGGWPAQFKYFLIGVGGDFMLGFHLYVIAGVLAVGFLVLIANGRTDRDRLLRAIALAIVTFGAYFVPTWNKVKNAFFGAEFQILIALSAVLVVHMLCVRERKSKISCVGIFLVIAMAVCGVWTYHFAMPYGMSGDESVAGANEVVRSIARTLFKDAHSGSWVTVTGAGWLNSEALEYLVRQRGKQLIVATTCLIDDPKAYDAEYDRSDFVVAGEAGVGEFENYLPSSRILDQTLQMIRRRPDFEQIGSVRSTTGKRFFLFKSNRFSRWNDVVNLLPEEKINPRNPLSPVVRWGVFPAVTLDVSVPEQGQYQLHARFRVPVANQEITIMADGREIARHPCAAPGPVEDLEATMTLGAGQHEIALNFSKSLPPRPGDPRPLAVLFKGLHFGPASAISTTLPTTAPANP